MTLASAVQELELDPLKSEVRRHYDRLAARRDHWYRRNRTYHAYLQSRLRRLIPPGARVLELGCATGNLLAALQPARGLGLDLSPRMIEIARDRHPALAFEVGDAESFQLAEQFDFVVASDLVGELGDITSMLERVRAACGPGGRLVLTFHSPTVETYLRLARAAGLAMPPSRTNWLGPMDAVSLLELSDYGLEHEESGLPLPVRIPGLSGAVNASLARLPAVRHLNAVHILVAAPRPRPPRRPLTCSVVIPCRNEVGNVDDAVRRLPTLGAGTELIFVDGASSDGTVQKIQELIREHRDRDIKLVHQVPDAGDGRRRAPGDRMLALGKGDAVRKGFEQARGDVLMILDADLTVPPEDLPRFLDPLASGKARFVNGSRLVYPMEERAMKLVNYAGNKLFSVLFSWLLEQRIRDTLCGTKALLKEDYQRIAEGRRHFGDFDPFGDFDLLFGAARLRLKIVEVPVRYRRRRSGASKVRVLRHGWLLAAMFFVGVRKLKLAKWTGRLG